MGESTSQPKGKGRPRTPPDKVAGASTGWLLPFRNPILTLRHG